MVGLLDTEKLRIKKEIISMLALVVLNIFITFILYYTMESRISCYNILFAGYLFINIVLTIVRIRKIENNTSMQ